MCSVELCSGKSVARGWCRKHYNKWRTYGDPLAGRSWGFCAKGHDLSISENVTTNGRSRQCLICLKDVQRAYRLKAKYGLTTEQWTEIFEAQSRSCAICQTEESHRWSVDHDHSCCPGTHTCGKCVRGILCFQCNLRIRALDEWSEEEMKRAQEYVQKKPILKS